MVLETRILQLSCKDKAQRTHNATLTRQSKKSPSKPQTSTNKCTKQTSNEFIQVSLIKDQLAATGRLLPLCVRAKSEDKTMVNALTNEVIRLNRQLDELA